MELAVTRKNEPSAQPDRESSPLKPVEIEFIHLFVQFAAALGQPRSVAEIYGLLFASEKPLVMDALI